jgi:deoxyxylulose-5-phosphate synthase
MVLKWSTVKTMSADGGHFGPRLGSLNTFLAVDHLRTIDDMFAILADWFQRRRF